MKKLQFFKPIFIVIFSAVYLSSCSSQHINLIVELNEEISTMEINNVEISIHENEDSLRVIAENYVPGRLRFSKSDFAKIESTKGRQIILTIETQENSYEIPLNSDYLLGDFMILRIYDLDNKKYQNSFQIKESDDQIFVFEIECDRYSSHLIWIDEKN